MTITSRYVHRSDSNAYRIIDGVAMIVGASQGKLRTLNSVGTLIWQQADGKHTVREIIDLICQEYDVSFNKATNDIEAFVQALVDKDMLLLTDNPV